MYSREPRINSDLCFIIVYPLGQFLPHHVGIPLGGRNGAKYYMLEIHYDNPSAKKGKL